MRLGFRIKNGQASQRDCKKSRKNNKKAPFGGLLYHKEKQQGINISLCVSMTNDTLLRNNPYN